MRRPVFYRANAGQVAQLTQEILRVPAARGLDRFGTVRPVGGQTRSRR